MSHRLRLGLAVACLGVAALTLPGASARAAPADGGIRMVMADLAKDVKDFLDRKGETDVAVGRYTGPPGMPSSSGPGITLTLSQELEKVGVEVRRRGARFTVRGTYNLAPDRDSKDGLHAVAIESTIVNKTGEEVLGPGQLKPRGVYGDAAKAILLGLTYSLPPGGDDKARDQAVQHAYENPPKPSLDHTKIKAGDSSYAVEVLVKQGGQYVPRAAKDVDGLAFVELKKDEVYRVRLYNDSDYEGTATLCIDGLSMFQFSELRDPKDKNKPLYDRLLVAAHGSYDIPGWHRTNDKNGSDEFQATKYADSAAAQLLPNSADIGTITVTFAACWAKDGTPPPDEPKPPANLGTTRPAEADTGYHEDHQFGVVRAAVSVRYSK